MSIGIKKKLKKAQSLTSEEKEKVLREIIDNAKPKDCITIYVESGEDSSVKHMLLEKVKKLFTSGDENDDYDASIIINKLLKLNEQIEFFSNFAKSEDENIRRRAIEGLGMCLQRKESGEIIEILANALEDESREVRFVAAKELGKIGDTRAVMTLTEHLNDNVSMLDLVLDDVIGLLTKLKDPRAVKPLIDAYSHYKSLNNYAQCKDIVDALLKIGGIGDYIDEVGGWLKHKVVPEYTEIITLLANTKDKRAIPYIMDENRPISDFEVFKFKVDCLAEIGDIATAQAIMFWVVRARKPSSWDYTDVRTVGMNGLLKLPQDEVLKLFISESLNLTGLLHSLHTGFFEDFTLNVEDKKTVTTLCSLLSSNEKKICCAAAKSLGRLKDESCIPFLEEAAKNSNKKISKAAKEAIDVIQN